VTASRVSRLSKGRGHTVYWAYHWAGGAALARHILDRPETVTGGRVLDLGAGSGIVGIAAAKAGAREVIAAEIDRYALGALGLNSELNGVEITGIGDDLTAGPPPPVNLVAVGDLFYERDRGRVSWSLFGHIISRSAAR
jgi:predicted nicotinamide N-methyase